MSILFFISYTQGKSGKCDALWLPRSALQCSRASLGISSKQQVLQSTVKNPAVFKGRNSVRKTSKQVTLLGIELNIPEAGNALNNLSPLNWGRELSPNWHSPNPVQSVSGSISSRWVLYAFHTCANVQSQMLLPQSSSQNFPPNGLYRDTEIQPQHW